MPAHEPKIESNMVGRREWVFVSKKRGERGRQKVVDTQFIMGLERR